MSVVHFDQHASVMTQAGGENAGLTCLYLCQKLLMSGMLYVPIGNALDTYVAEACCCRTSQCCNGLRGMRPGG